ncbi:MAG: metallophosphoesterase family protein [Deltaproteobacteria bacterium]|nr:metallophosphoesterase family protein [Deltaproteobacteria bacterium]
MTRRMVCATLTAVGVFLLGSGVARARPEGVRLSVVEPAHTSMGVAWNTVDGAPEAVVEYRPVPPRGLGGDGAAARPWQRTVGVTRPLGGPLGTLSEVVLTGLAPGATYVYRAGGPRGGFSTEYRFRTAPAPHPVCGHVRLAYAADSRAEGWQKGFGASARWPLLAAQALTRGAALILHGGDIVHDGRKPVQWAHHVRTSELVAARLPIMYALGNHDDGPGEGERANYNRLLLLPRAARALGGHGVEDYYGFRYGNAVIVALSTETFRGGARPFAEQARWLDRFLARNPARWRVVFMHRPIYTHRIWPINHPPNEAGQNAALVPILNKHRVDLVLAGHNHWYERFAASRCANGASPSPCPVAPGERGTVYVTSAGGGAFPVPFPGKTSPARPAAATGFHLVLVELEPTRLVLRALAEDGRELDRHEIGKRDPEGQSCDTHPPPP